MKFLFFDELNQEGSVESLFQHDTEGSSGVAYGKDIPDSKHYRMKLKRNIFSKTYFACVYKKQGLQLMRLIPDIEQQKRRVMICD